MFNKRKTETAPKVPVTMFNCGVCSTSLPLADLADHRCRLSGRQRLRWEQYKREEALQARRAKEPRKCGDCGRDVYPAVAHACTIRPMAHITNPVTEMVGALQAAGYKIEKADS